MKTIAIASLALLLVRNLGAQTTTPAKIDERAETASTAHSTNRVEVRAIRGAARYATNGMDWSELRVGTKLLPGAILMTRTDSTIKLVLGKDIGTVQVKPGTTLVLEKVDRVANGHMEAYEVRLDLRSGDVAFQVKSINRISLYEIKVPSGTLGVRSKGSYQVSATGRASVKRGGSLVASHTQPDGSVIIQAIR